MIKKRSPGRKRTIRITKIRRVRRPAVLQSSDGYQLGVYSGYKLGRRESVLRSLSRPDAENWKLKVLYVEEGLFNVNSGIIDALGGLVEELIVVGPFDDVVSIAQRECPDLVLVLNGVHGFNVVQVDTLRSKGFKTAVWFADDPYFTDKTKAYSLHYDYVFTHELACVSYYSRLGCKNVHYLPLAANPAVFKPEGMDPHYHTDICFIGTGFGNRIEMFNLITPRLRGRKIIFAGGLWSRLKDYHWLKDGVILSGVGPEESVRYYNGAKIVINLHRDPDSGMNNDRIQALSINPRTYEISACGAFQLTDVRHDLARLYTPGMDIETFGSAEELLQKIDFFLNNEHLRETIALRGLKTTYERHTYVHRLTQLLRTIYGPGKKFGTGNEIFLGKLQDLKGQAKTAAGFSMLGWREGYQCGWDNGYILGRSEAIARHTTTPAIPKRNLRIVYVTSGMGIPYSPIDTAVIDSLRDQVAELVVLKPTQNVASLSDKLRPDLVLVLNGMKFPLKQADAIRSKNIRTAVWLTDDPYYTDDTLDIAHHYDFVFTLELNCVPFYREHGCRNVYYLPFAADTRVFRPHRVEQDFRKEISFIGTAYWKRVTFFHPVIPFLASKNTHINGWWWDRLPNYHLISDKVALNDWMSPEKTADYYSGSKIIINLHRSIEEDSWNSNRTYKVPALSVNPRTFEINACATLQLTDVRSDLKNMYIPGEEIETYATPQELIQKVNYYLEHEEERRTIAWNGLRRTLSDHTYPARIHQLLSTLFG